MSSRKGNAEPEVGVLSGTREVVFPTRRIYSSRFSKSGCCPAPPPLSQSSARRRRVAAKRAVPAAVADPAAKLGDARCSETAARWFPSSFTSPVFSGSAPGPGLARGARKMVLAVRKRFFWREGQSAWDHRGREQYSI